MFVVVFYDVNGILLEIYLLTLQSTEYIVIKRFILLNHSDMTGMAIQMAALSLIHRLLSGLLGTSPLR